MNIRPEPWYLYKMVEKIRATILFKYFPRIRPGKGGLNFQKEKRCTELAVSELGTGGCGFETAVFSRSFDRIQLSKSWDPDPDKKIWSDPGRTSKYNT